MTWDCPKGKVLREKGGIIRHTVLGRGRGTIGTFVIENHIFCFDIPQIYYVIIDFILIKHGIML